MDFPSQQMRSASAAVHIFGASILAYCFAARSTTGHVVLKRWRQVPWARWCIMLVFLDSWSFHVCAGLLILGPGASHSQATCNMAIYLCIIIYCLSKILIYSFLTERVYVVWPHNGTRLSSKAYCLCLLAMIGYVIVIVLMIVGRNAFFDADHKCVIGLKSFASLPLLSYDLFLNLFLTSMFLWPLQQAHFRDVRLRKIASHTLCASLVALTTSTVNIAILSIKHGEEMGWVCLASCGLDVTVNALVLYWVTGYRPEDQPNNYLTTINFTIPYSSGNGATTSIRPEPLTPLDLAVPAPVQDKTKPQRHSSALNSGGVISSQDVRMSQHTDPHERHEWSGARDRSTNYPVARASTIENAHCERRAEGVSRDPDWPAWIRTGRWPWRRRAQGEEKTKQLESGLRSGMPFEVSVTTVHQMAETSRSSCGSGPRRNSSSTEGDPEVCQ